MIDELIEYLQEQKKKAREEGSKSRAYRYKRCLAIVGNFIRERHENKDKKK